MRASGRLRDDRLDRAMLELSGAANHSLLWLATAGVLALRKGQSRRAAVRGVAALAGASFTASLVAKRLLPRRRPAADLLPPGRRLEGRPTSSSFPSGHAASAAAFATAVTIESPAAGAIVIPLAAAVAYSRIHVGVHWPSDVAFGAATGAAVGLATLHWWPKLPIRADLPAPRVEVPRLEAGDGLVFLVNPRSGSHPVAELVTALWPKARIVTSDGDIVRQLESEISGDTLAIGVAGGDGSVAAAATVAARHDLPLAVVPAGTLNHFARDLGIFEARTVAMATESGRARRIGLGSVTVDGGAERWFVNTASLGGYPPMVRLREKLEPSWGRWLAGAIATVRTLRRARPLDVSLDGEKRRIWMIYIGNDDYRPKGMAPVVRASLGTGVLDVRYVRADVRFSRARFFLSLLTGTLDRSRSYQQCDVTDLVVHSERPLTVATDGEIGPVGKRFEFRARPAALDVYGA